MLENIILIRFMYARAVTGGVLLEKIFLKV